MIPMPEGLALIVLATLWAVLRVARRPAAETSLRSPADFALARTLARRGASSRTIAREARVAHDVAELARHLGPAQRRKKLPAAASSSAVRRHHRTTAR